MVPELGEEEEEEKEEEDAAKVAEASRPNAKRAEAISNGQINKKRLQMSVRKDSQASRWVERVDACSFRIQNAIQHPILCVPVCGLLCDARLYGL
jgi:hypothetical protein